MIVARTIGDLERARAEIEGADVAFVPTMGYLHSGHLSLVRLAGQRCESVVASIFVNPLQFGPGEDLERYPRDEAGDLQKLEREGTDIAFLPEVAELYPSGFATTLRVGGSLTERLCGAARPGHFDGVATVVARLFGLVRPRLAVFGRKDFQQLQVVRRMVADLALGVEIVGAPIVREADGLALSSRNAYLSPEQRAEAPALSRALAAGRRAIETGERSAAAVIHCMLAVLDRAKELRPEYVELVRPNDLAPVDTVQGAVVLALAARVGATRLIDNCEVDSRNSGGA